MTWYRDLRGTVYVLENAEAQRVKVGTTTNQVESRLIDVNRIWGGRKVTCQICGGRLLSRRGLVPIHPRNTPKPCPGGNALPIERDVTLAESHLETIKNDIDKLSGSEKGSATRIANNLEKRIGRYRHYSRPIGRWKVRATFHTECAEKVELLTHKVLEKHIDKQAPFGEVFCCSLSEATEAVAAVLSELGLTARREIQLEADNNVIDGVKAAPNITMKADT